MKIFDTHVHLPCYDGLLSLEDKKRRLVNDLDEAGVCGAIVIADSLDNSAIGSTDECVALLADTTENIFVIGGISPLIDFEKRLARTEGYLQKKQIVAVKIFPGHEPYDLSDKRLEAVFGLCQKYGVPLAIHTGWENSHLTHPKYIATIASERPNLKIVICHLYWPQIDLCYLTTKEYKNVYYDISSLASDKTMFDGVSHSLTRMAVENAERILFGSDYGECSIKDHIKLVESLAIADNKKRMIFSGNAFGLYNL
ncbi:MAG: amidohydrolase [Phycisphaerales bacterium]|nr:amidohydrolase [Phycisphaerales bacterium]